MPAGIKDLILYVVKMFASYGSGEIMPAVIKDLAPVVQTLDSAIHRINHYPVDSVIDFRNTYPLDRYIFIP